MMRVQSCRTIEAERSMTCLKSIVEDMMSIEEPHTARNDFTALVPHTRPTRETVLPFQTCFLCIPTREGPRSYLTQCIYQIVSTSQLPRKTVNLILE